MHCTTTALCNNLGVQSTVCQLATLHRNRCRVFAVFFFVSSSEVTSRDSASSTWLTEKIKIDLKD